MRHGRADRQSGEIRMRRRTVAEERGGMSTDYRRARGLDGLRAPAVASVVVYHVHSPWLPGGFLGVDLFFVISGYLITSLLAADHWRTGRIRLGVFWRRRALRLLPGLWLVLAVTACASTLIGGDAQDGLRGAVTAALTYRSDWWQLQQHDMYFADFGATPYLQHLWSLAGEEQFYLGWPLLLWAVMAVLRPPAPSSGLRGGPCGTLVHCDGAAVRAWFGPFAGVLRH
jgi:peptidoglycan/LPS O-acetylase OafA/YrhL